MNILFMCVANSARSQIAEGLARQILAGKAHVESAGSAPTTVNPWAAKVLAEVGIDIAKAQSKRVDQLPEEFIKSLDFVITLCAEEVCPVVISPARRLHWPLQDPAGRAGTDADQLARFRETRDAIAEKVRDLAGEI